MQSCKVCDQPIDKHLPNSTAPPRVTVRARWGADTILLLDTDMDIGKRPDICSACRFEILNTIEISIVGAKA